MSYQHDPGSTAPNPLECWLELYLPAGTRFTRRFYEPLRAAGGLYGRNRRERDPRLHSSCRIPPGQIDLTNEIVDRFGNGTPLPFDFGRYLAAPVYAWSFAEACAAFVCSYEAGVLAGEHSSIHAIEAERSAQAARRAAEERERREAVLRRDANQRALVAAFAVSRPPGRRRRRTATIDLPNGVPVSVSSTPDGYRITKVGKGSPDVQVFTLGDIQNLLGALGSVTLGEARP